MARRPKTPAPPPAMSLPAELTIYTVGELRPQWLAWVEQLGATARDPGDSAPVRADAVDQVDAAGLQLLMALQRSLAGRGLRLDLLDPSEPLRTGCQALGLGAWLQPAAPGVPA